MKTPYRFITIEGNIGAGKTTLSRQLSDDWEARLILEQFSDNPFLPHFYKDPERHAFTVELFFMTERHKQLQEAFSNTNLFRPLTISDYFFYKTLLFAGKNLKDDEYRLFRRLFQVLNSTFPKPDILLYLHRPVEVLLQNIAKRGRVYEQEISPDYLNNIQTAYLDYFKTETEIPVVVLDLGDVMFAQDDTAYLKIQTILQQEHPLGISYRKLED